MSVQLRQLDIYTTAIPMRTFEHAAAARDVARAVLVRASFDDGSEGWGECLPREYVTGETIDGVADDIERLLWPVCRTADLSTPQCLGSLPDRGPGGRCINSALCAFSMATTSRLLDLEEPADLRRRIESRVSGVLGSTDPARTVKRLRLMRAYGLRDFKLKLGLGADVDAQNLRLVHGRLAKGIAGGRLSLRVDVNGGWDAAVTPDRVAELVQYGVCVVEQPFFGPAAQLADVASRCQLPLMADESLLLPDDAQTLLRGPNGQKRQKACWWNIRISKNGGIFAAMSLAALAAENGVPFTIGCMVGESSILSAAQRRLLQLCPPPRFVEGNYGRFLLHDDLTTRSLRFGYGGRLRALAGPNLGIRVDPRRLARYATLVRTL